MVQRAEILHLKRIEGGYTNVSPQLVEAIGGDMDDMIHLKLEFSSKIECLIDTNNFLSSMGSIFSKLVKIEVRSMDNLKELCHGPPPSDFFWNLQELSINLCHQLRGRLFEGNLNLGRLKVFQVDYCRMLTSMFTPSSTAASLVLLEELIIEGCKEMRNIIANEEEDYRQEQIVQHDDNDKKVCGSLFPKLRTFDIRLCDQLEYIIPECAEMNIHCSPRRECLGLLSTSNRLSRQSLILRHVREMRLKNCLKIEQLFSLSVTRTMLLEELRIKECHSLMTIVTDVGDDQSGVTCGSVFPRLKILSVQDCSQMQYMLGQDHAIYHIDTHIDLPELEQLTFSRLPKLISTCSINYNAKYPSLKEFCLEGCPDFTITSISDFMIHLGARQLGDTTTEDLGEIMKYFHILEKLYIENSNIEGIFHVEELALIGQQMSSSLQSLKLYNLCELRYTFSGPKHFISLQNVKALQIEGCSKLEVIFSASVLRSLPQLTYLEIKDCEGLQKIMEEDEENQRQSNSHSQQVCFPKLITLVIKRCHSLKSLIPVSTFREFPKLELMIINEASQLDNMFSNERGDGLPRLKLGLPKLKYLVLMQLPTLSDLSQHMELQAVTCSVVHHCPKLYFASTTTLEDLKNTLEDSNIDPDVHWELFEILETLIEETERESPMTETIPQLPVVQQVQDMQLQSASQREVPCSQIADEADKEIVAVHDSEVPTSSTDLDVITMPFPSPSVIHQCETPQSSKERMELSLLECPEADKAITSISSTNSEPRIPSPGPLLIPLHEASSQSTNGTVQEVSTSDETMMSPQLVEKRSLDEQISMKQGTIREHSNLGQNVKSSTNGSVSKVVLSKTALAVPSNLQELNGSALAPVGDLLNDASAMISPICETNVTSSTSESMQIMSRSLLEEPFNNNAKVDSLSASSLILKADPSSELKIELAGYLNMSLEDIIDVNAFDHVERIINSLAGETKDAFQQNILKDFARRFKIFKESVPKAISTLQPSSEFISNYENMNVELNAKLIEGQQKVEDLETKLSETLAKECTIEMEIQKLIKQKTKILAQKNFLASQLDMYSQVVSRDYEKCKGLEEELKICTDRWLKSKEDLAHANASWKIFKEILRL